MRSLFESTIRSVPSASTTLMRCTLISPKFCGAAGWPNAASATTTSAPPLTRRTRAAR
jgi:hypothetical protein